MSQIYFLVPFALLVYSVIYCNRKYCMLKDTSQAGKRPFSWSRVQLAWWTVIVLAAFIAILINYKQAPGLDSSTVILLGISAATIAAARTIDITDAADVTITRHQDQDGSNFILDILSEQGNVSIARFQTVVFNFVFGIWFISIVLEHLATYSLSQIDTVIPVITSENLVLLGLSSATYAIMKTTENKSTNTAVVQSLATAELRTNPDEQPAG